MQRRRPQNDRKNTPLASRPIRAAATSSAIGLRRAVRNGSRAPSNRHRKKQNNNIIRNDVSDNNKNKNNIETHAKKTTPNDVTTTPRLQNEFETTSLFWRFSDRVARGQEPIVDFTTRARYLPRSAIRSGSSFGKHLRIDCKVRTWIVCGVRVAAVAGRCRRRRAKDRREEDDGRSNLAHRVVPTGRRVREKFSTPRGGRDVLSGSKNEKGIGRRWQNENGARAIRVCGASSSALKLLRTRHDNNCATQTFAGRRRNGYRGSGCATLWAECSGPKGRPFSAPGGRAAGSEHGIRKRALVCVYERVCVRVLCHPNRVGLGFSETSSYTILWYTGPPGHNKFVRLQVPYRGINSKF